MFKKISGIILFLFWGLCLAVPAAAQEKKPIYFFWSQNCPHCSREKVFLGKLADRYPELAIQSYEISASQENLALFKRVGEKFANQGYTPFTVVGEFHFIGFLDEATTGKQIEEAVACYLADGCEDAVAPLLEIDQTVKQKPSQAIPESLNLPLVGQVKTKHLSLPVLTLLIGMLDGFNPCAMWTLLFLISLLLGMKDRKRMWLLGTVFILASGMVYFLFMSAWLNLFLFLGFVFWVRMMVGLFALGAGSYSLRDFWINRKGGCETMGDEKRQKVFAKIKKITEKKELWLAVAGMILLALVVNLIELVCSAGLPAIYTQILSLTPLSRFQYYGYLFLYLLVFMADDLFVFGVAMVTLQAVGIQAKYARWSRLIGGILMFLIGVLLLFKPEWLIFG